MNSSTLEAKSKFETLLTRNKAKEQEIERSIQNVIETQGNATSDPQSVLTKQLEVLDQLRVLLAKRATYLSLINNQISMDPMTFNIVLGGEVIKQVSDTPKADSKSNFNTQH